MEVQPAALFDLSWPLSGERHFHVWQMSKRLCLISLYLPMPRVLAASMVPAE